MAGVGVKFLGIAPTYPPPPRTILPAAAVGPEGAGWAWGFAAIIPAQAHQGRFQVGEVVGRGWLPVPLRFQGGQGLPGAETRGEQAQVFPGQLGQGA